MHKDRTEKAREMKGTWLNIAGLPTALAASICCITPVLALLAGSSGVVTAFSWTESTRPYLVAITLLILGFAWFQKFRANNDHIDCACRTDQSQHFLQSKKFLGATTLAALILLAFPYYGKAFYPPVGGTNSAGGEMETLDLRIGGMTCPACENHVKYEVSKLPGIWRVAVDHKQGNARVIFDPSKTTVEQITHTINQTGYRVRNTKQVR